VSTASRANRPLDLSWTLARIAMVVAVLGSTRYFAWRFDGTLNPDAAVFSALFLAVELIGFVAAVSFFLTVWRQPTPGILPAPADRRIDILISSDGEPVGVLRDTVACAVSIQYPHGTWILDRAARRDVAELAAELGCHYLAPETSGETRGSLLNRAAAASDAEFLATLDAEHVPTPDFVERMVGYFSDPGIAVVQANLDFYNLDSFQHSTDWEHLAAWHQQVLFFNVVQPGKDMFRAAIFCGSPAMLRRSVLLETGGFATETVTESLHTGLRLQMAGQRVAYCPQRLARGLAPQTFDAFEESWRRWGMGTLQVLRRERPLTRRGLGVGQRLCYLTTFALPFTGLPKLGYLAILLACVLSGTFPILATPGGLGTYLLPYLALNIAAFVAVHGGIRPFFFSQRYGAITLGALLRAVADHLRGHARVRSSGAAPGSAASGRQVAPYLIMESLLALVVVIGVLRIADAPGMFEFWGYGTVVLAAVYGLCLMIPVVALAMRRKEARAVYRFPQRLDMPVRYRLRGAQETAWSETYARNLNRFGLSVTLDVALPPETGLEVILPLPSGDVTALGTVRWTRELSIGGRTRHANGIRFERIRPEEQDAIARHLFWEVAPRHGQLLLVPNAGQVVTAET